MLMIDHLIKSDRIYWFGTPNELSPEINEKSPPIIPFKKDSVDFSQSKLSPIHIFEYLPKDHDCYIYADIFKQLDYSPLINNYSPFGQHAFHPGRIIEILTYAYCHGVFSSRQIERKCYTDLGFMYISRMNCPNFRVLSDFRKDNLDFFQTLFTQSVAIAEELNLVDFKKVSQDGSKFKANSSKHKAMSYGRMKKNIGELNELVKNLMTKIDQIESEEDKSHIQEDYLKLKEELQIKEKRLKKILDAKNALELREEKIHPGETIPDKSQISFADSDARIMGKRGNFDYCYNGQICVDSKDQIIITQFLTQNANDKQEVTPALMQILRDYDRLPDSMSFDNGYFSGSNLEALSKSGVNAFVAVGRKVKQDGNNNENGERFFVKSDFRYFEDKDVFICPKGNILHLKYKNKDGKRTYSGNKEACLNCKSRSMCCKSKKGQPRTISTDDYESLRNEMRVKMEQPSSKEIYARRKVIVEPVFGQVKNQGFKEFHLRGFEKTEGEFALICSAHNIRKIIKNMTVDISFHSHISNIHTKAGVYLRQMGKLIKNSINSINCTFQVVKIFNMRIRKILKQPISDKFVF